MEGPNRELEQTAGVNDEDFETYASEMLQSIDGMLLGRRTYDLFAGYWPTATGPDAERMNELPKVVFSKTLKSVDWKNARLAGDVTQEVLELKRQSGRDIAVFGSAGLASSLIKLGLIDEYRILVSPFVIGNGGSAFKDIRESLAFKAEKIRRMEFRHCGTLLRAGVISGSMKTKGVLI